MKITFIFKDITFRNNKYEAFDKKGLVVVKPNSSYRRRHQTLGVCWIWWQINLARSPEAYKANPALMSDKVTNFRQIRINAKSCCRCVCSAYWWFSWLKLWIHLISTGLVEMFKHANDAYKGWLFCSIYSSIGTMKLMHKYFAQTLRVIVDQSCYY